MRVPWTTRRSNQSILKENNPEGLMLELKLQYFGYLVRRANSGKDPDAGKRRLKAKGENVGEECDGFDSITN